MCGYDAFEHLYRSLFAKPSELFVMLTAYLDDSGTDSSKKVITVAGYLGTVHQWESFNRKWASFLSDYGVKMMRRSDLENFQGEFKGWTPEKRTRFIRRAQSIIRKHTYSAIGQLLVKADFDSAVPPSVARMMGGPYGFCGYHCLKAVGEWCDNQKYQGGVHYVFEAGTEGHGQLDKMLNAVYKGSDIHRKKFRFSGWSFKDKSATPLQAADVIAYEMLKIGENHIVTKSRKTRASARALFRQRDLFHTHYWTPEDLKRWTELLAEGLSRGLP
jgi:hypothetical protein